MQREVIFVGPRLARLFHISHGVYLHHGVVNQFVHVFLRCDMKLQHLALSGAYNELSLSPSQPGGNGAGVVARRSSQHAPYGTILMRFVLFK